MNVLVVNFTMDPTLTKAPFIFAYQIKSWMFLTMIVNHKPILRMFAV